MTSQFLSVKKLLLDAGDMNFCFHSRITDKRATKLDDLLKRDVSETWNNSKRLMDRVWKDPLVTFTKPGNDLPKHNTDYSSRQISSQKSIAEEQKAFMETLGFL